MKFTTFAPVVPFAALALAACSSAPPQSFPPLDYSYLPPIVFKVSTLNIVNAYVPDAGAANMIAQDPAPPAATMMAVLQHRIVASGAPGTGTVTLETASVDQIGGNLVGRLTVDINLTSPDGRSTGFAEASVTASAPAPDPDASENDVQAALYGLTKQLMDGPNGMNVQLQYQMQQHLSNWISWSGAPGAVSGPAAQAGAIQAAPLPAPPAGPATGAPATSVPATSVPGTGTPVAPPLTLPGGVPATLPVPPPA
jgi:hypothetical protein